MPTTFESSFDLIVDQQGPEWDRRVVIEQYVHSSNLRYVQTLCCMIQNGPHLFHTRTWKPFDKLIDATAVFQVLEKSGKRDTGATKNPVPLTRSGSRSTVGQVDQSNMMLS